MIEPLPATFDRVRAPSTALHQLIHRLRDFWLVDPHDIEYDVPILDHANFAQALSERLNQRPVIRVGR